MNNSNERRQTTTIDDDDDEYEWTNGMNEWMSEQSSMVKVSQLWKLQTNGIDIMKVVIKSQEISLSRSFMTFDLWI